MDRPFDGFERGTDAVINGDIDLLTSMLSKDPKLIHARSTRAHHATLLHYVSGNGVEDERQKSPPNAVSIAKLLLDAGSEVDALADCYGKSTTLGLAASSAPPRKAGVQLALLELLLGYGASIDGVDEAGSPLLGALRNGKREAAEYLAQLGARLDLEGAAGVGNLPRVEGFFDEAGTLKDSATKLQMEFGFLWACEYGRISVIQFLLSKGVAPDTEATTGLTGLHWAIVGGEMEAVQLLLTQGASLTATNEYGGTALSVARWAASNGDSELNYVPIIDMLIRAGAA